ncbi:hypothetical protein HN670_00020 [bacterium]|jgi:hypothetical protein|nr:hypothetical protein [bacterium]
MSLVKRFSVFALMIATVFTMSAGTALQVKAAGNYTAGDLLAKDGVSGAAVYYIGSDGMKYVFPDVKTYNTWYDNFDNVVRVDVAELDMYADGGTVTYRAGTKLVTHENTAKVYALEPGGVLRWIPTGDVAESLFGANWGAMVLDVLPGYFASYTAGSDLGSTLPEGTIAIEDGGDTYYYIADGAKRPFSTMDAFEANNFNLDNVLTMDLSGYSDGESITGEEIALSGFMASDVVVIPEDGNLTVSLSSATPAAGNVVINVDNIVFGKFNFTAGDADAIVNSVKIGRSGLGSTGDFTSVTLYDGSTKLGSTRTSWSSDATINYNISSGWDIPAGTTKELTMVGKLDTAATYNALGILEVGVGAGTVSGSLPIYGNEMTGVNVTVGGVTITDQGTAATKNIGDTDVTMAEFRLAINSVEDAEFTSITLKNKAATSNASDDNVANLKLYKGADMLAGSVQMVSDKIVFVLDEAFAIEKSKNETFKVIGDITNGDGNTIEYVLDATTDLSVMGDTYGTSLTVTSTGYDAATEGMIITIDGAELNIAFTSNELKTIDDQTDVEFGTLVLSAGSTDVKITNMIFTIDETDGNSDATDNKDVDEFELVDVDDGSAYVGTMTDGGDADADDETWTYTDEIWLAAGQARTFTMRGDLPTGIGDGDSYKVTMTVNTTNITAETDPEGDAIDTFSVGSIVGKLVTVNTPYLTITPEAMNAGYAVINDMDVELFKGTIEAVAGDVTMSRMRFEGGHATAGNVTYTVANMDKDNWSGVGLYLNGSDSPTQLLTSSNLTEGELDFNSFSATIADGDTIDFVVKGDVGSTLDSSNKTVHLQLDTVTAKDGDNDDAGVKDPAGTTIATTAELESTRTVTLTDKGILYTSLRNADAGYNKDRVVLASDSQWVAKLRMRAQYEDIRVEDLKLTNTVAASEDSLESVCLYSEETATEDYLIGCTTLSTADVAFFNDIDSVVEQGTEDWYVYVNTRAMGDGAAATADTTDAFAFRVTTTSGHLTAVGVDSNETLAFGDNDGSAAAGEIVFDTDLDGTFDEAADTAYTATGKNFIIAGSKVANVSLVDTIGGETVDTVISGTGEYTLAILQVDTADHSNTDSIGNALVFAVNNFVFDVTKYTSTTFSGATIERIGGTEGAKALVVTACDGVGETDADWTLANVSSTMGVDSMAEAGDTAYFVIKGTIDGLEATTGVVDWVRVSLDSLNTGTNNIDWFDGYDTTYAAASDFDYVRLDTSSITGTKVAENL